jgi:hypothetical protein
MDSQQAQSCMTEQQLSQTHIASREAASFHLWPDLVELGPNEGSPTTIPGDGQ